MRVFSVDREEGEEVRSAVSGSGSSCCSRPNCVQLQTQAFTFPASVLPVNVSSVALTVSPEVPLLTQASLVAGVPFFALEKLWYLEDPCLSSSFPLSCPSFLLSVSLLCSYIPSINFSAVGAALIWFSKHAHPLATCSFFLFPLTTDQELAGWVVVVQ